MKGAALALARGAWTEHFNQDWRFSRIKTGLWLVLVQIGLALLFLRRLEPPPTGQPLSLPIITVTILRLFGAFIVGLVRGREHLFGKSVLRLLHVSAVPGTSILGGLTLAGLPQRAVGSLCLSSVVLMLVPAGDRWWALPLLWALALVSSLAGYAAALVSLIGWIRVHPKSLAILWGLSVGMVLALANVLVYLVIEGGPMEDLATGLGALTPWLVAFAGSLTVLPGLVVLVRGRSSDWYREAYLKMQELGDGHRGFRPSRWPRILPGPAGALQAGQWREIWLNWFTWARLGGMLLVLGTLSWKRTSITSLVQNYPALSVIGFGLAAALGAFGELPGAIGVGGGPNIGLSMVAGVRAKYLVLAKWVAASPLALFCAGSTAVTSWLLGQPSLLYSLTAGCIGLGCSAIMVGAGILDLDPHAEVAEPEVPEVILAVLEQVSLKMNSVIGLAVALVFTLLAVGLCIWWLEAALPIAIGLCSIAHLALVPGYIYLRRLGM